MKRRLLLGRKVMTNLDSIFKSRDMTLPTKFRLVKAMVFPVVMYGCESWTEESQVLKNWCFWTVVLEKTLESPLDCKEMQPVHSKGDQSWVFIGRSDAEAETPVLWPPHSKSWLIGKDPDPGRDWGQEEKGMTKDEMAGWHHRLDGHEFEWTPGVGDGQGGLVCCNSWGHKESNTTEQLNKYVGPVKKITKLKIIAIAVFIIKTEKYWNVHLYKLYYGFHALTIKVRIVDFRGGPGKWLRIRLPMQEMHEIWVPSLGWEDPLEKEMATYSSILAWRIPWTEEPGRLQSVRLQELDTT